MVITPPRSSSLQDIAHRVEAGERLSFEDGVRLFESDDLLAIGRMADLVRRRKHGDVAYFNINRRLEPTNACVARCSFCSFYRPLSHPEAYTLSLEEIAAFARSTSPETTEVHIVGGLNPKLPFSYFTDLLRTLRREAPHLHLKAFTAVEIVWFAEHYGMTIEQVLRELREAGLQSLPGGGAEIFAPRVRRLICDHKTDAEGWLEVHRTAHRLGLRSNATMLYGHIESYEDRVDHLLRLRELQDETGGFQAFIGLPFLPQHNLLGRGREFTGGADDLKVLAVARLLLDNFDHIKAYWVMVGLKLAQVALSFGVDDLDGTIVKETIAHNAGADSPDEVSAQYLADVIREAGRRPVERDTLYNVVREW
jgi:aminodeoxyfutalosine synthase